MIICLRNSENRRVYIDTSKVGFVVPGEFSSESRVYVEGRWLQVEGTPTAVAKKIWGENFPEEES